MYSVKYLILMEAVVVTYLYYNSNKANFIKRQGRQIFYVLSHCCFLWKGRWWCHQMITLSRENLRRDRNQQRFVLGTLLPCDASVFCCFSGVWHKKLVTVVEKCANIVCIILYQKYDLWFHNVPIFVQTKIFDFSPLVCPD